MPLSASRVPRGGGGRHSRAPRLRFSAPRTRATPRRISDWLIARERERGEDAERMEREPSGSETGRAREPGEPERPEAVCPLWPQTADLLRALLAERGHEPLDRLLPPIRRTLRMSLKWNTESGDLEHRIR